MLRASLRPYFACLLLLCLSRTLLPEAWVLALHGHAHTTEEPAFTKGCTASQQRAVFTAQHTHCHTEQFYEVPFAVAPPVILPQPHGQLSYRSLAVPATLATSATAQRTLALRGPPRAC